MIVLKSVIFALAVSTAVFAYPANKDDEQTLKPVADVDFVPLEAQRPGVFPPDGVVDVDANGAGFFGNPFNGSPFPSIFESFNDLMTRLRQQFDQILGRLPANSGEFHIPHVGDFDLGKGNTTSVTKVINGHKVTINETEYKQDNDNGGTFFKVRVVDVHPDSAESVPSDVESVVPVKDVESMENGEDDVKKVKDNEALKPINIETFEEIDSVPIHDSPEFKRNIHWGYAKPLGTLEDNSLNAELIPPPDLTNDINVNQILADSGAPTNPDAEVFDVTGHNPLQHKIYAPMQYFPRQYGPPEFERFQIQPTFDNNIPFFPNAPYQQNRPNFQMFPPMFPPHQAYLPRHYLPVEQGSAITQTHSAIPRSTTIEDKETTHKTAVPSQTDANAST
ncbi:hypothetical protein RI129_007021 [Pyrocoelia pectoralis]|uniref:Icarapin-like n=1 Tax=Pyrocoelia pectoralis TaxID=417401 RepID=A0AAN7ZM44_9COLE